MLLTRYTILPAGLVSRFQAELRLSPGGAKNGSQRRRPLVHFGRTDDHLRGVDGAVVDPVPIRLTQTPTRASVGHHGDHGIQQRDDLAFPQSLPEFQQLFPDDAACAAYLGRARWPDGFVCCSAPRAELRCRPMPTFIPARGRTLQVAGVCVNRIGTDPASDRIRLLVETRVLLAVTVPPALPNFG